MAVPDKRYTFDRARPSTPFEHLEHDHADHGAASCWSHYLEFATLAGTSKPLPQDQAQALAQKLLSERYSIHFHVWTFEEFRAFLDQVTAHYLPRLSVSHCIANGDEGIFILEQR